MTAGAGEDPLPPAALHRPGVCEPRPGDLLPATGGGIGGKAAGERRRPGGRPVMKDVDGDLIVHRYYDGNDNGTPELGVNLLNGGSGRPVAY